MPFGFREHRPEIPENAMAEAIVQATARAGISLAKARKEKRRQSKMKRYQEYHPETVDALMKKVKEHGDSVREGTGEEMYKEMEQENPDAAVLARALSQHMEMQGFKPRFFKITPSDNDNQ